MLQTSTLVVRIGASPRPWVAVAFALTFAVLQTQSVAIAADSRALAAVNDEAAKCTSGGGTASVHIELNADGSIHHVNVLCQGGDNDGWLCQFFEEGGECCFFLTQPPAPPVRGVPPPEGSVGSAVDPGGTESGPDVSSRPGGGPNANPDREAEDEQSLSTPDGAVADLGPGQTAPDRRPVGPRRAEAAVPLAPAGGRSRARDRATPTGVLGARTRGLPRGRPPREPLHRPGGGQSRPEPGGAPGVPLPRLRPHPPGLPAGGVLKGALRAIALRPGS